VEQGNQGHPVFNVFFSLRGLDFQVFLLPKGSSCLGELGGRRKGGWHCCRSKAGHNHVTLAEPLRDMACPPFQVTFTQAQWSFQGCLAPPCADTPVHRVKEKQPNQNKKEKTTCLGSPSEIPSLTYSMKSVALSAHRPASSFTMRFLFPPIPPFYRIQSFPSTASQITITDSHVPPR
jgi:hypothetical protein